MSRKSQGIKKKFFKQLRSDVRAERAMKRWGLEASPVAATDGVFR